MSKVLAIGTSPVQLNGTPFSAGFNVAALNFTAGAIALTGSDTSGGTYTAVCTVPTLGAIDTGPLPKWIKAAAASVYLISGN